MTFKETIIAGLSILIIVVMLITALDFIITYSTETPEYQAGYQAGYTEQNETKYQAACNISNNHYTECTTEQYHYAKGYKIGYRNKQYDLEQNEKQNKTNNSLEILRI